VAATTPEDKQMTAMRIVFQRLLHNQGQTVEAFAHVGMARREPDATSRRYRDHDRSAFKVAAISVAGAFAQMRTRASCSSTMMTPGSPALAAGGGGEDAGPGSTMTGANSTRFAPFRAASRHL
jgi:hypothetical protein